MVVVCLRNIGCINCAMFICFQFDLVNSILESFDLVSFNLLIDFRVNSNDMLKATLNIIESNDRIPRPFEFSFVLLIFQTYINGRTQFRL